MGNNEELLAAVIHLKGKGQNFMDNFTIQVTLCVQQYVKDSDIDLRDFTPIELVDYMVERGPGVIIMDPAGLQFGIQRKEIRK